MADADGPDNGVLPPPEPKAPPIQPNPGRVSIVASIVAIMLSCVVSVPGIYAYYRLTRDNPPPAPSVTQVAPTEARFQDSVSSSDAAVDTLNEWRAARSDHKIIALAIARCLHVNVGAMSRDMFSALLLDLRPDGDHRWQAAEPSSDPVASHSAASQQPSTSQPPTSNLSAPDPPGADPSPAFSRYSSAMLAFSDAISRARISAAAGAGGFYPQMWWFGWISVIVSAGATAVVTWRASMNAATADAPKRLQRWLPQLVGVGAILLSTTATVLTGAKQFWDPTNAYIRNETALLALKQLHQNIVLTFVAGWNPAKCDTSDDEQDQSAYFRRWRASLVSLQIGTMPAPVIVPNTAGSPDQPDPGAAEQSRRPSTQQATSGRPPPPAASANAQ